MTGASPELRPSPSRDPGGAIRTRPQGLQLLLSRPILQEYLRVLAYPKFRLTPEEIRGLLDEVLPFVESVRIRERLSVVRRDPADDKFLECAVAGRAAYIVISQKVSPS
jgi:uncharacterized protein